MDGFGDNPDNALRIEDDLKHRFETLRANTMAIVEPLSPEDCNLQSMPDASPAKWHLGHTTWFWEMFVLSQYSSRYQAYDSNFNYLFNSYYEAIGPRQARPQRGLLSRPSLDEVKAYRACVDEAVSDLLNDEDLLLEPDFIALMETGIAHEEQHQELMLTDLKHGLFHNPLLPAAFEQSSESENKQRNETDGSWTHFNGGLVEIGAASDIGFSFDNEGPRHKRWLEPFDLANRLVTNRDYLAFIEDGGYRTHSLWLAEGWTRVQSEQWTAPFYWFQCDGEWFEFTLHGAQPLDLDAPCAHVSFLEANAYADWTGYRLPTEAEWEVAAVTSELDRARNLVPGCSAHPQSNPGHGLVDLFGEVWQWTRSDYEPYPGFRAPEGAIGEYNGKFMCGQYVLRGSSCATANGHSRATYRNFFYPADRWQFSGIRLARDV